MTNRRLTGLISAGVTSMVLHGVALAALGFWSASSSLSGSTPPASRVTVVLATPPGTSQADERVVSEPLAAPPVADRMDKSIQPEVPQTERPELSPVPQVLKEPEQGHPIRRAQVPVVARVALERESINPSEVASSVEASAGPSDSLAAAAIAPIPEQIPDQVAVAEPSDQVEDDFLSMAGDANTPETSQKQLRRFVMGQASTPHPAYPLLARRQGWQGTAMVELHVRADGLPESVRLLESSGFQLLDAAALETLEQWQLASAPQLATQRIVVPVVFRLH